MKFKRFKMSALLAVNEAFLSKETPLVEDGKAIVGKVISIFEYVDPLFNAVVDLGLDANAQNFEVGEGDSDGDGKEEG